MMKTVMSKEVLNQTIFDIGYDEALEHFDITEDKAELILFGKPDKIAKRYIYHESGISGDIKVFGSDHNELTRVLEKYFAYIKYKINVTKNTINKRGLDRYDRFMNGIERILSNSGDFIYQSDLKTVDYIIRFLEGCMKSAARKNRRTKTTPSIDIMGEDLLHELRIDLAEACPYDLEAAYNEMDVDIISMVQMKAAGYTEAEIAEKFTTSQPTVSRKLRKAGDNIMDSADGTN